MTVGDYVRCHDCDGSGCDYCDGLGQVRVSTNGRQREQNVRRVAGALMASGIVAAEGVALELAEIAVDALGANSA